MKAVIMGCGRVGAMLAAKLVEQKWDVTAVDANPDALAALGDHFPGRRISGRVTDEETMKAAGVDVSDLVVVLTSDDIVNLMAAQMARTRFHKDNVLVRVRDSIKAGAYRELGLLTICPSTIELDMIMREVNIAAAKV